ncbi:MAG: hypothetical protein LBE78_02170 [Burkholderiaceae bacterium]|nr:hypothetical protein [Burkholderiaceae bacterium]
MELTPDEVKDVFSDWWIRDCAIRGHESLSFLLLEDNKNSAGGKCKIVNFFPSNPTSKRIGWQRFNGFRSPILEASRQPLNQAIVVSLDCDVGVLGAGATGLENNIPNGKSTDCMNTSCQGLKTIDGVLYATGGWRSVCRRIGANRWENIVSRKSMPLPAQLDYGGTDGGFRAIDGFSQKDIYCVGGLGDVWRYDGEHWYACNVPTNMVLHTVCCAGDGYVYIGMQMGSIMRGREDSWEIIHKGDLSLPFRDMVWYQGKVWCTSDYGLWVIEGGKLREVDEFGPEVYARSGSLAVGDGLMLLAGLHGATIYDGKKWSTIL